MRQQAIPTCQQTVQGDDIVKGSTGFKNMVLSFADSYTSVEFLVNMCAERNLCIGSTWFKKKLIHEHTLVSGRKINVVRCNVLRAADTGMSGNFLVEDKVKIRGRGGLRLKELCIVLQIFVYILIYWY